MHDNKLLHIIRMHYDRNGPRKAMGRGSTNPWEPHFYLVRRFLGDVDLAIIFNTKRCRFQCRFCNLPAKSTRLEVSGVDIERQFANVINRTRTAIGILDRLTLANEGSIFDADTFPPDSLSRIVQSISALPGLSRLVFETRLEFVDRSRLDELRQLSGGKTLDILTGFETHTPRIRDRVLGKREPLSAFLLGLDRVAEASACLTAYVLFKPDPHMSDEDAIVEAEQSICFLEEHCRARDVPLTVRLNPMYAARGTQWEKDAEEAGYSAPRLSDVLALARKASARGVPVYLGLTSEGLASEDKTFRSREDFSNALLKSSILWNRVRQADAGRSEGNAA